jgi:ElaB/YqjD/DUF883 family membrane-anchored ribosome-binding protein
MRNSASQARNRVQAAVEQEGPTIAEGLQTTTSAVKRLASESVGAVRDTANDFLDQGKAKVHEIGDTLETRVREEPMKSVLIAAGLGFVIGLFFWRR